MKAILRGDAGFDGFSVTDWDNCHSLLAAQHVAADMPEASVLAAKAGNDMMMTSLGFYDRRLTRCAPASSTKPCWTTRCATS